MRANELRNLTLDELQQRLDDSKQEAFNLRFQQASGQLEDTNRLRILRREIVQEPIACALNVKTPNALQALAHGFDAQAGERAGV